MTILKRLPNAAFFVILPLNKLGKPMQLIFNNQLVLTTNEISDKTNLLTFEKNGKHFSLDAKKMTSLDDTIVLFKDFINHLELPTYHSPIERDEVFLDFGNISLHLDSEGKYLRIVENGDDEEILSFYWTAQEFVDYPEINMGSLIKNILDELDSESEPNLIGD